MKNTFNKMDGLTLIELMIVVAIIAFLVVISAINARPFFSRGHDARRKSDLELYRVAFEHYYDDHQCYPPASAIVDCGSTSGDLDGYVPKIVCDPVTKDPYAYVRADCHTYQLYTNLEYDSDPIIEQSGCAGTGCGSGQDGDTAYNYGVGSQNAPVSTFLQESEPTGNDQHPNVCAPGSCGLGCPSNYRCTGGVACSHDPTCDP